MLRLLLDEQMDPAVVAQMRDQHPNIPIDSLHTWEDRRYLRTNDAAILAEACRQSLTLVTYDTRTIVPLLKAWGESGTPHGGVIFVKSTTIAQDNIGGLMRALVQLWEQYGDDDWTNVTTFLTGCAPLFRARHSAGGSMIPAARDDRPLACADGACDPRMPPTRDATGP